MELQSVWQFKQAKPRSYNWGEGERREVYHHSVQRVDHPGLPLHEHGFKCMARHFIPPSGKKSPYSRLTRKGHAASAKCKRPTTTCGTTSSNRSSMIWERWANRPGSTPYTSPESVSEEDSPSYPTLISQLPTYSQSSESPPTAHLELETRNGQIISTNLLNPSPSDMLLAETQLPACPPAWLYCAATNRSESR